MRNHPTDRITCTALRKIRRTVADLTDNFCKKRCDAQKRPLIKWINYKEPEERCAARAEPLLKKH
jgi:hypothetical protein